MNNFVCPKCGERENLHYNYDYANIHPIIESVLCNECGEIFKDTKLAPYQRLKSIFNEGELTQKGSNNLDAILGIEKKKESGILLFFKKIGIKIDSMIFKKPSKISNIPHKRLR